MNRKRRRRLHCHHLTFLFPLTHFGNKLERKTKYMQVYINYYGLRG